MASLDISLDDMIKNRKNIDKIANRGQGRPQRGRGGSRVSSSRGGGRSFGAPRKNPLGVNARPSSFAIAKSTRRHKNLPWQNGLFEDGLKAAGLSGGMEAGAKLNVTNLDFGVSSDDIRELFSEVGELVRYALHYDKNGRSSGSAEVVFARKSDALKAHKRYNNVQLDGRPMKIEIIGAKAEIPMSARVNVVGGQNRKRKTAVMTSGPSHSVGIFTAVNRSSGQRGRGGQTRGRGGGRVRGSGRGGKKKVEKSADDLDKELESYHAEAMQT